MNILGHIGNTPLLKLNRVNGTPDVDIFVKCEFMNPGGSIKDRMALRMIEEAVSAEKKDNDRIISYLQECYQLGVEVLPVDINQSDVKCTIDGHEKHLRLGFSAIVSQDEQFIEDIVAERRENGHFQNFQDFCERISIETIPSSFFTRCVEAGAFDAVEASRTSLFAGHGARQYRICLF